MLLNQSILKEINPEYPFEGLMLKLQDFATWREEPAHWKRPWCWERLKAGGEGDDRGWDGWMASLTQRMWETPRDGEGQGGLACCGPWGLKESDTTERLNWTELMGMQSFGDKVGVSSKQKQGRRNNITDARAWVSFTPSSGFSWFSSLSYKGYEVRVQSSPQTCW